LDGYINVSKEGRDTKKKRGSENTLCDVKENKSFKIKSIFD